MDAMRGTISAEGPSWTPRGRTAAIWIALVAALWGGFAVGRGTAPATPAVARPDAAMHQQIGLADMPLVIPTGQQGRVWGHWDSAPVRVRSNAVGLADPIRARHHHRVKWG